MVAKVTAQQRSTRPIFRASTILDGEPTVQGARVPVRSIVLAHRRYPDNARLRAAFPMLTDDDIAAALAFYEANRAEIERHIRENAMDDEG